MYLLPTEMCAPTPLDILVCSEAAAVCSSDSLLWLYIPLTVCYGCIYSNSLLWLYILLQSAVAVYSSNSLLWLYIPLTVCCGFIFSYIFLLHDLLICIFSSCALSYLVPANSEYGGVFQEPPTTAYEFPRHCVPRMQPLGGKCGDSPPSLVADCWQAGPFGFSES